VELDMVSSLGKIVTQKPRSLDIEGYLWKILVDNLSADVKPHLQTARETDRQASG
jgi:hypothetical protein